MLSGRRTSRICAVFLAACVAWCLFTGAARGKASKRQTSASSEAAQNLPAEWKQAIHQLAARIAKDTGEGVVQLGAENRSSLLPRQADAISADLRSELEHMGVSPEPLPPGALRNFEAPSPAPAASQAASGAPAKLSPTQPAAPPAGPPLVQVILSESADEYVWIAEIEKGGASQMEIVSAARANASLLSPRAEPVLQRRVLWEQREPILDFSVGGVLGGPPGALLILQPNRIVEYSSVSEPKAVALISEALASAPQSRDARARLAMDREGRPAVLFGGFSCALQKSGTSIFCSSESPAAWPVGGRWSAVLEPGRNYFAAGTISPSDSGSPGPQTARNPEFLSAAIRDQSSGSQFILAELDGKARLYSEDFGAPEAVFSGWGDEIATVPQACDSDWHVLVSGAGDGNAPDSLQIFRISGMQAIPEGERLELSGPVVSMWVPPGEQSVRVVSRDLQTGSYEASLVSAACGD